ncbi:MAG: hypothetical protein LBM77_14410 [Spirochaetaceae bacterium]|jgi:hypothetical protein|nr:hypothetical protein [Spirochaetaceae bacterium]
MKKIILAGLLVLGLRTMAFAEYEPHALFDPNTFGLGIQAGGLYSTVLDTNVALGFKLPDIPVFFAINLGIGDDLSIGVSGDWYAFDDSFFNANTITIGWYAGPGMYADFKVYEDSRKLTTLGLGFRLPVGISVQFFNHFLETYFQIVPHFFYIQMFDIDNSSLAPNVHFDWWRELGFEAGLRIWL